MPKVVPVAFVSSTMRDLKVFRELTTAVLRRNCVAYIAMEDFPATHLTPNENIDAKLEPCDVYIGILGGLYGSIPNGQDKSYTELEYRLACEYKKEMLLFVADEQSFLGTADMFEQHPEKKKQLGSLKTEWQTLTTVSFTSQNFEQKFEESIKAYLARHEHDYHNMELACLPLDSPEKGWIRDLYSSQAAAVMNAIPNLANVRCALEHFYALLIKGDPSLREPLFMALDQASSHLDRVFDILGEMLSAEAPELVSRAVLSIGRHARRRKIPEPLATRIIDQLAKSPDDEVRFEVAHALWKLPEYERRRWKPCAELAKNMISDPDPRVGQRAQLSHQTLNDNR